MILAASAGANKSDLKQTLLTLVDAQRAGSSCLPAHLGLATEEFKQLICILARPVYALHIASEAEEIREELLALREQECADIVALLQRYQSQNTPPAYWLSKVVAAGCMGGDHLWRDLGLPTREHLTALFDNHFPELSARNTGNMRWKKFLYKQLCESEGHYVCRAPSCEICPTYEDCFGDER